MPKPHLPSNDRDADLAGGTGPEGIARVVAALRRGDVVAFPTDTVYALAASLTDQAALQRLYEVKGRPDSKPIPVLLDSVSSLARVALPLNPDVLSVVQRFWPGPLTVVLPARSDLSPYVTAPGHAGRRTVAVRVPDHPLARSIINRVGGALAATSANISGRAPARTGRQVLDQLGDRVSVILDGGAAPGGIASTVVEIRPEGPVVLREGSLPAAEIVRFWQSTSRAPA